MEHQHEQRLGVRTDGLQEDFVTEEEAEEEIETIDAATIAYVCRLRIDDLRQLGYGQLDVDLLWKYVSERYSAQMPMIHEVVSDIMSVQPQQFMHWLMMQDWKNQQQGRDHWTILAQQLL